jgi:hypothetical protein
MPDATSSLLAMYQQLLGGSAAREQSALEAACAQRVVLSGLTISPTGVFGFPGTLALGGGLAVTGKFQALYNVGTNAVTGNVGGTIGFTFTNLSSNQLAQTLLEMGNDAANSMLRLVNYSSTAGGALSEIMSNGSLLQQNGSGGLTISASASDIKFFTNGIYRARLMSSGEWCCGGAFGPIGGGMISLQADPTMGQSGLTIKNASASNVIFAAFYNNATAIAGAITQSSSTTVNYGTSSDARLKIDRGPAKDVDRLRRLKVRDFFWKEDERPDRGLFAQDVRDYPYAITPGDENGRVWQLDYSKFVADLIAGWQEHDARLRRLEES